MSEAKKPLPPAAKPGLSSGGKIAVGCALFLLTCLAACCGGAAYLGWWGWSQVDSFAQDFVARGYRRQTGQVLVVPGPVDEPTVYTGQVVKINGEVNADIAIMSQVAEISGEVDGDIDFYGQVLHIKPDAIVRGDIRVEGAQVVKVEGAVEGEITGDYGVIQDAREGEAETPADMEMEVEADAAAEPP
ncbi:MAG: polymer-forming cytoskeletal protein [Planctomycetes bacterium]|nr:polymer-forming cytoskeletal protein [Planctomycetota bacterium]